jgi:hypothetical protein
MIIDYASKNFKTQVWITRFADATSEINIKGRQRQLDVRKWVIDYLEEFLYRNYPDEWEDSLDQHCKNLNL